MPHSKRYAHLPLGERARIAIGLDYMEGMLFEGNPWDPNKVRKRVVGVNRFRAELSGKQSQLVAVATPGGWFDWGFSPPASQAVALDDETTVLCLVALARHRGPLPQDLRDTVCNWMDGVADLGALALAAVEALEVDNAAA